MTETILLKNFAPTALGLKLAHLSLKPHVLRKIQSLSIASHLQELPERVEGIKTETWTSLRREIKLPHLDIIERKTSPHDGFTKYLFRGEGEGLFEAVRIPLLHRPGDEKYIICVSSQVGCAAKCAFCATGRMGFKRHLAAWEIVDQVVKIREESIHPVRGVVFMGMGEPFLNYAAVTEAASIMSDPCGLGIDAKAITFSTVGVVPMIKRFTEERRKQRLIVSLTSAIDSKRDQLLPMNLNYPIASIMDALRAYQLQSRRRVTFAWTMMSGINMDREEVRALASATQGLKFMIDLIPVNDATGRFKPPSEVELHQFMDLLNEDVKCPIIRRYSGGADIHAACGMLSTSADSACQNQ